MTYTWAMCTYVGGPGCRGGPWLWAHLHVLLRSSVLVLRCQHLPPTRLHSRFPSRAFLRADSPGCGALSRRLGSPRTCLRVLTPVRRCVPAACPWARLLPVLQQLPHVLTVLGTHSGKAHACAHLHSHVTGIHTTPTCTRAASPVHRLPCAFPCTWLTCCHAVNYLPPCSPPPPPQNPGRLKCCNIVAA